MKKAIEVRASIGDISVLEDYAELSLNRKGITPLHIFALRGDLRILNHPSVSTVFDKKGRTPLHILAELGHKEILKHSKAFKPLFGETSTFSLYLVSPACLLLHCNNIIFKEIKEIFPYLPLEDEDLVTMAALTMPIPNSVKLIYSL